MAVRVGFVITMIAAFRVAVLVLAVLNPYERKYVNAAKKLKPDDGPNAVLAKEAALGRPESDKVHELDNGSTARLMRWSERDIGDDYLYLSAGFYPCRREQGPSWCLITATVERCSSSTRCKTLYEMKF